MATRRLIVRGRIIGIKFLVDTEADVSIPVLRHDRTHISDWVLYAANEMIIPMNKNYSSLLGFRRVFQYSFIADSRYLHY